MSCTTECKECPMMVGPELVDERYQYQCAVNHYETAPEASPGWQGPVTCLCPEERDRRLQIIGAMTAAMPRSPRRRRRIIVNALVEFDRHLRSESICSVCDRPAKGVPWIDDTPDTFCRCNRQEANARAQRLFCQGFTSMNPFPAWPGEGWENLQGGG